MARILTLLCWLLPAAVLAEPADLPPQLPVEYFTRDDQMGKLKISPDGKQFAIDIDGKANRIICGYRAGESTVGTKLERRKSANATPKSIRASSLSSTAT